MSELPDDVKLDLVRLKYLERSNANFEQMLRKAMDDNAVLLRRALEAEMRIIDHMERKQNPDHTDYRLWGQIPR